MEEPLSRLRAVAFVLAVFVTSLGAVFITTRHTGVPAIWPASAISACALVVAPRRSRPWLLLAVFLAMAFGHYAGQRDLVTAGALGALDCFEAVVVTWWLTRNRRTVPPLISWGDARRFLEAVLLGSVPTAVAIGLVLSVRQHDAFVAYTLWTFASHLGPLMVIVPLALRRSSVPALVSPAESGSHALLLAGCLVVAFQQSSGNEWTFLVMPFLLWSAARFSARWAGLELLGVSTLTVLATGRGLGPFAAQRDVHALHNLVASTQAFLIVSAMVTLTFGIAFASERQAARKVAESEANLEQMIESASGTAFIGTDLKGTITLFSPGAEQLLGYTSEEVVGLRTPLVFHVRDEIVSRAEELGIEPGFGVFTHLLQRGASYDTREWTYVPRDGNHKVVSLSYTAVRDADGVPTSYLGIVRDVTHRLEVEQALQAALDTERELTTRMREVDMAKTDFVANVSHELRTPLASIIGYTELLEEEVAGDLNPAQRDLVGRIVRNSGRLLGLIEDLLTLGEIERGTFEMDSRPLDLRDTVRAAVEAAAAQQTTSGVALSCELPDRPVVIQGDAAQLERLVMNLLGNALKFTLAGGWVRLSVHHARAGTVLTVADNGIGIPKEEQDQLFQRCFRASSSREQEVPGTGLGLSIVRSIAEAHGGTVACESQPGEGTTFQVTFPKQGVISFPSGNQVAV